MRLRTSNVLVGLALVAFVFIGMNSISTLMVHKPLPEFLMEDYGCYSRALTRANAGGDPYEDHDMSTGYLYPPQALLWVTVIEAFKPLSVRFTVFALTSLLCMAGVFWLVMKNAGKKLSDPIVWVALPLVFLSLPVELTLYIGQVNLFVAFTIAAGYFLSERKPWLAGALIASGAMLKITPAFLMALFIHPRHAKLWGGAIITTVTASLATGFIWGFHHYLTFVSLLDWMSHEFPVGVRGAVSLINAMYLVAGKFHLPLDGWEHRSQQVITLIVVAACLFAGYVGRVGHKRDLAFATICVGLTVTPHVLWVHHFAFMLAAVLVIIFSDASPRWLQAGAYFSLAVVQLNDWIGGRWQKITTAPSVALLFVMLLVALWLEPSQLPVEMPSNSST